MRSAASVRRQECRPAGYSHFYGGEGWRMFGGALREGTGQRAHKSGHDRLGLRRGGGTEDKARPEAVLDVKP